jgi:DNA-binding NarL/FixJ family response regulator
LKTRILIVDGYAPFRNNLAQFLASLSTEYDIVGEAATDEEALTQVRRLRPDLVLVDSDLPDRSGLSTTRAICQGWTSTTVITITNRPSVEYRDAALAAGAVACVDKPALVGKLPGLLEAVLATKARVVKTQVAPESRSELPFST